MSGHRNCPWERSLEGDGRRLLRQCKQELRSGLVAPDFSDIAFRIQHCNPGFWSEEQCLELRQLPATLLHGADPVRLVESRGESTEFLGPEFMRVFEDLRQSADLEASRSRPDPFETPLELKSNTEAKFEPELEPELEFESGSDIPEAGWHKWLSWIIPEHPGIRWGAVAAAALVLIVWSIPDSNTLTWRRMTNASTLAEFLSNLRSDAGVTVAREVSSKRIRPTNGAPTLGSSGGAPVRPPPKTQQIVPVRPRSESIKPPASNPPASNPPSSASPSFVPEEQSPPAAQKREMSIAELERRAQRAWQNGEHQTAISIYYKIIARAPKAKSADMAWGDIFLLLRDHGSKAKRRQAWKTYQKRFPDGHFIEHAMAGLCRTDPDSRVNDCWERYRSRFPKGVFIHEAQTSKNSESLK